MFVAIMQPTYLPWIGYFDLIDTVDHFVLLDNVQFAKRSWQQRNRIRTSKGLEWLTVPIGVKGKYHQHIAEAQIADESFIDRHLKSIQVNYKRSVHFNRYYPLLEEALRGAAIHRQLGLLNNTLIRMLARELSIETRIHSTSELNVQGSRSELLINICRSIGANSYVSPPGSLDYLRDDYPMFEKAGIRVLIQVYEHPVYKQVFDPFMPFASTIDLLFNEGPRATKIIRSGRRPMSTLRGTLLHE